MLGRRDPPRELRKFESNNVGASLVNVRSVFQQLAETPRAKDRIVKAWNPPLVRHERAALMDRIAETLAVRLASSPEASTLRQANTLSEVGRVQS
ncbi:MAG: hypothetical protein ACYSVY_17055 [Planctomycetota bacterium]